MTDDTHRVSGIELAREFYRAHELEFQRAAATEKTGDRGFDYSDVRFDAWAVGGGFLRARAIDCADSYERTGVTMERTKLRYRLNAAARAGDGLPRAFSIEASHKKWRVELAERFVAARPLEIANSIGTRLNYEEKRLDLTRELLNGADHLSDTEKTILLMQLETVTLYIFNAAQLHELILRRAFDPDYRNLNLRSLRAKMARLMRDVAKRDLKGGARPKRKVRAARPRAKVRVSPA